MGTTDLAKKKCRPCEGGVEPLSAEKSREMAREVPGWEIAGSDIIRREFIFDDFRQAQAWLNNVADIAESEDHHPDIQWSYNKVTVELTTHAIGGLSENDFILAAKINELD
jgi:4a-hydroxytetrahydrobiopterin dehydratase